MRPAINSRYRRSVLAAFFGCCACSSATPTPPAAPAPVDTAIHIYSIAPLVGSTIAYGVPVQVSGHYTVSAANEAKHATATVWLCLGMDLSSLIVSSCLHAQQLPTDDFQAATTLTISGTDRLAATDTKAVHVLLVDGSSLDPTLPASAPLTHVAASLLTRISIPHAIHWQ
jgi:hypothetical protein